MPKGVYKRTPEMKTGKYERSKEEIERLREMASHLGEER